MITLLEWNTYSQEKQDELTDVAFSYRQCEKCKDYFHLGEQNEDLAEGMYLQSSDFDCTDDDIINYEKQHNIQIDDNVFCYDCINKIDKDLERNKDEK